MAFLFLAVVFLFIGRKLGWFLSRSTLYTVPITVVIVLCVGWGLLVAAAMRGLLNWQQPGSILRWIMGYALGCYVAIPNFGLFNEDTIPNHAGNRHQLISTAPLLVYIACAIALAFLFPYV